MSLVSRLQSLARIYLHREKTEAADDEEVRSYVELLIASKIRDGANAKEARRAALVEVGGIEQVLEQVREVRIGYAVENLARDINYARRSLFKNRGFSLVASMTIALGVGFGGAIFSLIASVMLRPLPFPDSDRLVAVSRVQPGSILEVVPYSIYRDWCSAQDVFSGLAAFVQTDGIFSGGEVPDRAVGRMVSASFFPTLGAAPALGRFFTEAEDAPGGDRVLILGHGFWQRRFHSDPDTLGRTIEFNGEPWRVVGILPANFDFYGRLNRRNDFFIPLGRASDQALFADRKAPTVNVIGRLNEGIRIGLATRKVAEISQRLAGESTESSAGRRIVIRPLLATYFETTRSTLLVLSAAVSLVFLISLGTVANLMLSRAVTRQDEIALRLALGGTRVRVLRLLLAEAALLCAAGAIVGAILAAVALVGLRSLTMGVVPRAEGISLELGPLVLVVGLALLTAGFFHVVPFLRFSALLVNDAASGRARRISQRLRHRRLRRGVVVVQFGLSMVLLLTSSLLLKSFWHVTSVNPGYDPTGLLTMRLVLPSVRYSDQEKAYSFFQRTMDRVAALSGVEAVSVSTGSPMDRSGEAPYWAEGEQPLEDKSRWPTAYMFGVNPSYHQTLRIPIMVGRYFGPQETSSLIVDEIFARRRLGHENISAALGERLKLPGDADWREIVGVVGSVRHDRLDRDGTGVLYIPWRQLAFSSPVGITDMFLIVRSSDTTGDLPSRVEAEVRTLDKDLTLGRVATLDSLIRASVAPRRLNSGLLISFAVVALVLAAVGSYGVLSYAVVQRAHEIGIRVALGASRTHIMGQIVGEGLGLAGLGAILGLGASVLLARVLRPLLYDVSPYDFSTYGVVLLSFLVVALLATVVPAYGAVKIDPVAALRCD